MKLILARHGNTFGPGDTPVWVGAKEDYPLVEKGLQQAHDMAAAIKRMKLKPDAIIAGPLLRTKVGAEIISQDLGFEGGIRIDERLKEIDYGSWGGKSDGEVEALFGAEVIDDWRERTIRPAGADWAPDERTLRANAEGVLSDVLSEYQSVSCVLLITSNGNLRFFHSALYDGDQTAPSPKVKTGHLCLADVDDGVIHPRLWNVAPNDI